MREDSLGANLMPGRVHEHLPESVKAEGKGMDLIPVKAAGVPSQVSEGVQKGCRSDSCEGTGAWSRVCEGLQGAGMKHVNLRFREI